MHIGDQNSQQNNSDIYIYITVILYICIYNSDLKARERDAPCMLQSCKQYFFAQSVDQNMHFRFLSNSTEYDNKKNISNVETFKRNKFARKYTLVLGNLKYKKKFKIFVRGKNVWYNFSLHLIVRKAWIKFNKIWSKSDSYERF